MTHKIIAKGLLATMIFATSMFAIEIKNAAHAVDMAGKQRMFTQRMLKDYAMIGMGNCYGKPQNDLDEIVKKFSESIVLLTNYTKNSETKKSLDSVKKLWEPIEKILIVTPSKELVGKLQEDLEFLLKAADASTKLFAIDSGNDLGEVVNTSGRQRMLSQRMASLYMLKVWGIEDPKFKLKLDESTKLFSDSQIKLEALSSNTDEINKLLKKARRSFTFFEMMGKSSSKYIPTLIYKKSNDILRDMNSATQKYVSLEAK